MEYVKHTKCSWKVLNNGKGKFASHLPLDGILGLGAIRHRTDKAAECRQQMTHEKEWREPHSRLFVFQTWMSTPA